MAYELEAFLGAESTIDRAIKDLGQARCVPLAQGVAMIPMTQGLFEELQAAYGRGEEPPEKQRDYLTAAVAEWARAASRQGLLAYCEVAYANTMGGQSVVIWAEGAELERLDDDDSVNQALRRLGVTCEGTHLGEHGMLQGQDEWDTVGLGRFRRTEKWLDLAKS